MNSEYSNESSPAGGQRSVGETYEKPTVDVVPLEQVVRASAGSATDCIGLGGSDC